MAGLLQSVVSQGGWGLPANCGVVLDSAAGKDKGQSRKIMLTQVLREWENHRSHNAKQTEVSCSVHFVRMGFSDFTAESTLPPQPSLPHVFSYQDEVWGNEKESSMTILKASKQNRTFKHVFPPRFQNKYLVILGVHLNALCWGFGDNRNKLNWKHT